MTLLSATAPPATMPPPDELIVLPSLVAQRGPSGGLILTQKYLNGTQAYRRYWPGKVTTLVQVSSAKTSDMDHVEVKPGDREHGIEMRPADPEALTRRLRGAAMVVPFLSPFEAPLAATCRQLGVPLVYISEYSPRTEIQIVDATTANPLRRLRRKWWVLQAERKRRAALRLAAGIQCSGTPTYEIYRHIHPNALLFFDNRVAEAQVITETDLEMRLATLKQERPLRLVFGGRLIAMKGVLHLTQVAQALRQRGVSFTLDIYGDGNLRVELERQVRHLALQKSVRLRGSVDFERGWVPMLKRDVDLFLCCHPQGDPSSTYPEVMACGVPFVGYANEAFLGIVKHSRSGWSSPLNDPAALASTVARLDRERSELAAHSRRARTFATAHAFEATYTKRVAHLVEASRLPKRTACNEATFATKMTDGGERQ